MDSWSGVVGSGSCAGSWDGIEGDSCGGVGYCRLAHCSSLVQNPAHSGLGEYSLSQHSQHWCRAPAQHHVPHPTPDVPPADLGRRPARVTGGGGHVTPGHVTRSTRARPGATAPGTDSPSPEHVVGSAAAADWSPPGRRRTAPRPGARWRLKFTRRRSLAGSDPRSPIPVDPGGDCWDTDRWAGDCWGDASLDGNDSSSTITPRPSMVGQ